MSDRYLLIGTSYLISSNHFDLLFEIRPNKPHISPTKYLQTLHKQGNNYITHKYIKILIFSCYFAYFAYF